MKTVAEARAELVEAIDKRTLAEKLGFNPALCQMASELVALAIDEFAQTVRHDENARRVALRAEADALATSDPKAGGHA